MEAALRQARPDAPVRKNAAVRCRRCDPGRRVLRLTVPDPNGYRFEMKLADWTVGVLGTVVALSAACGSAQASDLRVATWNLEHLNDAEGEGCIERSEEDYDAIGRRIEALDADVVAFQEVENEAAARRVFDPAKWSIAMSSRPDAGQGPVCWDRPEGRLQHQATGIAVRRSVGYRRATDISALARGNTSLRWGVHIVVGRGARKLHILSVHLKSGCWGASQDAQGRDACTVLRGQMRVLRAWIDERRRSGDRFAIAGDFNRRIAIPGDWAWSALAPEGDALELATANRQSRCDSRYPDFIDHIVLGGPDGPVAAPGSFREGAREGPHPDHCPVSIAVSDGPRGSATTRSALKAWTSAFARTSTDQIVGGIERRLLEGPASYATLGRAVSFEEGDMPDLSEVVSRASFRLSPRRARTAQGWSIWGGGAMGSMSANGHDLQGRVHTATLGFHGISDAVTTGVAVSHSTARGSTTPTGPIEAKLSTVSPYFGIVPRQGFRLWGVVGKGAGKLSLEPTVGDRIRTELETVLGAVGLRIEMGEARRIRWSSRASAALTAIETGELADLEPIDSTVGRLRVGVEGSRSFELRDAALLTPRAGVGLHRDVGDEAGGTAVELGAGLHYASADGLLTAEAEATRYVAGSGEEGWSIGGQIVLRPDARQGGVSLRLAPMWSAAERGELSDPNRARHLEFDGSDTAKVAAEIGYDMRIGNRDAAQPYAGIEWARAGNRTVRLGTRWNWGKVIRCSLGAQHDTADSQDDAYAFVARAEMLW